MGSQSRPKSSQPQEEAESGGPSFTVVGVGASAGGLEAFTQLLKALPLDTGMGFVLVQHLAPSHPSALAEILSRATRMPVTEVEDEVVVQPNHVYVIPPGQCMIIERGVLHLLPRSATGINRPVDQFFRALAEDLGHKAIGVVLSGTASDGTLGLEAIKAEGGIAFAQDASAQQEGMPLSAIASGSVDFVLPPEGIAAELARIARHPWTAQQEEADGIEREPHFPQILQILHKSTGVDFSQYKFNTIYRRINRRMLLHKVEGTREYLELLRHKAPEAEALYQDILIGVTSFFRDPEAFEALKQDVFPALAKERNGADPVRVWTLGCSTGQEAYSLAMAWTEYADSAGIGARVQLFATDLSGGSVEKARGGLYSKDIEQDVSPERLRRFFTEMDGGYRISKSIREMCVFSRHNVLADPPFSRIDLISCRNLLIYLEPVLQQQLLPTLHYALKPTGWLWLGGSETIGSHRALFDVSDQKNRIYSRKTGSSPGRFRLQNPGAIRTASAPAAARLRDEADLQREADRILSNRYAPPGVVVSADLDILQYRGDTGRYLAPTPGKASLSLLKMLREGLLVTVRAAIVRAGRENARVRSPGVLVASESGAREVAVEVIPLGSPGERTGYLVLFLEPGAESAPDQSVETPADGEDERLAQELLATREYLQSVIEQQESANEELQSANEEVQSANEELQSVNEELETSKEEIQSSNEELVTVNEELNNRNSELGRLNDDLANLLGSIEMAVVMLGPDLRVRRFTAAAERQFNLIAADVGRPFGDIRPRLPDLGEAEPLLKEVLATGQARELELRDREGRWYSLRLRPYHAAGNRIDGVVMMLVDVDAVKRVLEYTENIVATVREPLLVLDAQLCVLTASRSFYEVFQATPETTEGRLLYELGEGQWDVAGLRTVLEQVLPADVQVSDFEVTADFPGLGLRTMRLNARRLVHTHGQAPMILLAIEDVTESDAVRIELGERERRFRFILDSMPQKIFTATASGDVDYFNPVWVEFTGLPLEEILGWGWRQFIHPEDLEDTVRLWRRAVDSGAPFQMEHRFRCADGDYRWHLSRARAMMNADGTVSMWVGSNTDIHDQRQTANQLRQYAADLSEADRHKNEFLAMLAHELRNPMAPITNAMRILIRPGSDTRTLQTMSEVLERQVRQMARLLDDLLDVSRISRGKFELRKAPLDLASVVGQAIDASRPQCDAGGHELTVRLPAEPIHILGDGARLAQVVSNLLNNACKFTEPGGHIGLTLGREGEEAVIRVRDDGIGVEPSQLPRIFDMFVQMDTSLARPAAGIGVGLTLVKTLVEMHEGSVEARSEGRGTGSEFTVRLPLTSNLVIPAAVADAPVPPSLRILVVDDNRDATRTLSMLLQYAGHETRVAYDGAEALEVAEEFRPEVILLDIGLPRLNGYEVAEAIRKESWGKTMTLVALTGWGQEEERGKSRSAGMNAHLVKPLDFPALQALLAEWHPVASR